jgi:ABC-type polysaccharide/polyol phosphate export permease
MSASDDRTASKARDAAPAREWFINSASQRRWPPLRIGQLWVHRELIYFFAARDLRVRYKQAYLGFAWAGIQPVVGAVTFTVLFNRLADVQVDGPSYFAFALLGSSIWAYFSTSLQSGTASLLYNADLLTKVSFPRIVAPAATLLPGLIDLGIGAILALIVSLASGGSVSAPGILVGLPAGLVLLVISVAGPVFLLSAAVVKYRDVTTLVGFAVQLLLFLSPVAFPPELVPVGWRALLYVNPLAGALGLLRWSLVDTSAPTALQLLLSWTVAAIVLLGGLAHFRRREREFADII